MSTTPTTPTATSRLSHEATSVGLVREHAWTLGLCAAMATWTAVLFGIAYDRYHEFREGRFDLGNMVQAVWSTTQGRVLEISEGSTGEQMTRLGAHVDPFLVLLAPVWMVWSSPLALALAQILVVSLGALPVFWLGRRHLGSETAAGLLALGYLAYPWTATSAIGAIHPVTFAIPLLLFCVWFLDTDRLLPFALFAVLAMSTGELMGLPVAALGVWYALARESASWARRSPSRVLRGRSSRSTSSFRRSQARTARSSGSTTTWGARRKGSSARSSPIRARSWARSSRHTTSCTSSCSGCRCSSSSSFHQVSRPSAFHSCSPTCSPTSAR